MDDRSAMTKVLSGWGRTAPSCATIRCPRSTAEVAAVLAAASGPIIARGLGRSYNDAAQVAGGTVLDCTGLNLVDLDRETGRVSAGAGVSLDQLLRLTLPEGWFVPVTPGTRQVTLGGALAGDVHGKNHHVHGSFADRVHHAEVVLPDGTVRSIAPDTDAELYWATAGGMGLTGVITAVDLQLIPVTSSQMLVDTDRARDLDHLLALLSEPDDGNPYSVAWIDLVARGTRMGRGVVTRGRHATAEDLPPDRRTEALAFDPHTRVTAPSLFPPGALNQATVRAFNEAWFRKAPERRRDELQPIPAFFHPLDGVAEWNRVYGPHGFLQYQFVVPDREVQAVVDAVRMIARAGVASFLAVLKRFGPANRGWLSFPMEGWTLALDLPNVGGLGRLLDQLDEVVVAAGGRVNLTKDARVPADTLAAMYPRLDEFRAFRDRLDPNGRMASDLARRLSL